MWNAVARRLGSVNWRVHNTRLVMVASTCGWATALALEVALLVALEDSNLQLVGSLPLPAWRLESLAFTSDGWAAAYCEQVLLTATQHHAGS